ncbi:hypothetical protein QJS66_09595 [Kocuria rhizophila]|nr:hypothetical protein QJS66_09595 [Kocuria rhizophila]
MLAPVLRSTDPLLVEPGLRGRACDHGGAVGARRTVRPERELTGSRSTARVAGRPRPPGCRSSAAVSRCPPAHGRRSSCARSTCCALPGGGRASSVGSSACSAWHRAVCHGRHVRRAGAAGHVAAAAPRGRQAFTVGVRRAPRCPQTWPPGCPRS